MAKKADKRVEKLLRALAIARQQQEGNDLATGLDIIEKRKRWRHFPRPLLNGHQTTESVVRNARVRTLGTACT